MKSKTGITTTLLGLSLLAVANLWNSHAAAAPPSIATNAQPHEPESLNIGPLSGLIFPSIQFKGASVAEVLDYYSVKSRDLDPQHKGLSFLAGNDVRSLLVKISAELHNMKLADAVQCLALVARLNVTFVGEAVHLEPSNTVRPPYRASRPTPKFERQSAIRFPSIVFKQATLAEAVEFLRVKGHDLDPAKDHVSILIDPSLDDAARNLTLDLKDVPLAEAARYIATLSKAEVICLGDVFYLQPKP